MMTWLEIAQNLPLGQKVRYDCPECGLDTNTNAAIVNHTVKYYSLYCNACGFNPISSKGIQTLAEIARIKELNELAEKPLTKLELPDDYTQEIPQHARLWLLRAGITESVWRRYKVGYSKSLERVVLPVRDNKSSLIWYQCRALLEGQKPKYIQPSRYKGDVLFRSVRKGTGESLVIVVEDILSAIRVGESFQAVSILGTKLTTEQASVLGRHTIGVWLDPDRAGVKGSRTIRRTLGLVTDVFDIQSEVDPKHLSNKVIKELVNDKYNKFKQRNITDSAS
jgi:predicted RNA-binding Zn-ribbon protein involved in translation (DUF1610 family)